MPTPQFSQSLSPELGAAVHAPPYIDPPRGAVWVDRTFDAGASITGGGGSRPCFSVFGGEIIVPAGWELRLSKIGFSTIDPADMVYAAFQLTKDGNVLQGYEGNPVAIGSLDAMGEIFLHVAGPATIGVVIFNNLPNPIQTIRPITRICGWMFKSEA
jgi:hypothetical protein